MIIFNTYLNPTIRNQIHYGLFLMIIFKVCLIDFEYRMEAD